VDTNRGGEQRKGKGPGKRKNPCQKVSDRIQRGEVKWGLDKKDVNQGQELRTQWGGWKGGGSQDKSCGGMGHFQAKDGGAGVPNKVARMELFVIDRGEGGQKKWGNILLTTIRQYNNEKHR